MPSPASWPRLGLILLLGLASAPALAADYADEPPPPPDVRAYPPPEYGPDRGPSFGRGPGWARLDGCRTFVRRRFDADGEPVLRRVRVCDEPDRFDGPPRYGRPDGFGPPGYPWRPRW